MASGRYANSISQQVREISQQVTHKGTQGGEWPSNYRQSAVSQIYASIKGNGAYTEW